MRIKSSGITVSPINYLEVFHIDTLYQHPGPNPIMMLGKNAVGHFYGKIAVLYEKK
jgi:hypothetical protein